jgi:hypothetical protein
MYTVVPLIPKTDASQLPENPTKKPDKYNGFKVPLKSNRSLRWCNHIYTLIKETRLDQRDDVRTAFNNLVDCINKYGRSYTSLRTSPHMKYYAHIRINPSNHLFLTHVIHYNDETWDTEPGWLNIQGYKTHDAILKIQACHTDIITTYGVLYELIKRDVIPYMEMKTYEQTIERKSKYYRSKMKMLENTIKSAENKIERTRERMVEYVRQYEELQNPPKLTVFD